MSTMNADQAFQLVEDFRGRMVKYRTENAALKAEVERLRGALFSIATEGGAGGRSGSWCSQVAGDALAPSDPQPAKEKE